MATTTSVGSTGLDVNALVTQLVSSERAQYQAPITVRETKATVQLSAVSALKGALSTFQVAVNGLKTASIYTPRTTSSSDEDVLTATATGSAATGSYDVKVIALAKAQQLASGAFAGGSTTVVGTGTLTITYGSSSFNVDIGSANTLAGIRDAINKATGNTGVQATILNEQGGARLLLTGAQTGAANTIKIAASGGDGGLAQLAYDGVAPSAVTQIQGAQDAHIKIADTYDHYSASNVITGAIDNVTLNLKSTSATAVTVNVTEDTEGLKDKVASFVQAYNTLYTTFTKLRSYDASTQAAGPMLGDALLRGVENQIGLDLSNPVAGLTGTYTTLASIGVMRQTDGTLAVDSGKLDKALSADRTSVAKVFGGDKGVAGRISTDLTNILKDGGALDARTDSLTGDLKKVQKDKDALDARMLVIQARYTKQFTALDGLLQQLQTTSNFLTSQLSSLPGASSK